MATQHPLIGSWYEDVPSESVFEVVAIDEYAGTVEIQYSEGSLDQLDLNQWDPVTFRPTSPPGDTLSAFGMNSDDDWDDEMPVDDGWSYEFKRMDDRYADFDDR